jgi:hypothetical protein
VRGGFPESDYWRHYEAFYAMTERIRAKYPNLILQQASGGGSRLELATAAHWDEHFTSDRAAYPFVYQMASGLSVYLPPEILVTPNGMAGNGTNQPDLVTMLRGAYALGNTPMIFNAMLPKRIEDLKPEVREKFLHAAAIYKDFIRPLLATCRVYHHAPVSATGGVESGSWLAMEFASPGRTKGWATVIRLSGSGPETYRLKLKGLDAGKQYSVTFDNTAKTETIAGSALVRDGVVIRLPPAPRSELLLFRAQE